jgi:hypothetical protein
MSRLFNNQYFNELEELGEMTTEQALNNFKSRIGLTRYEISDITGQKQRSKKSEKEKYNNI